MKHLQSIFLTFVTVLVLVFSPLVATDVALAADSTYQTCYEIAANSPAGFGNPILRVDLGLDNQKVNGEGEITPNLTIPGIKPIQTYLEGSYIAPLFLGAPYLIISANGYNIPPLDCTDCGIGPARVENVKDLEIDTLSNDASYEYREVGSPEFVHVGPVPVHEVECPAF